MLRDVISSHHLQQLHSLVIPPAQLLEPSLEIRDLHPRPMAMAAAFLFAGSTSSKAQCVSQRHTDTRVHTQKDTSGSSAPFVSLVHVIHSFTNCKTLLFS